VVKAGPAFELLATNKMGEVVMATPARTGGILIIRGLEPSVRNCGIESANSGPLPTLLPEE